MNQHIDSICQEPQDHPKVEPADLGYWSQLGESYQPEWFHLTPAWMLEG